MSSMESISANAAAPTDDVLLVRVPMDRADGSRAGAHRDRGLDPRAVRTRAAVVEAATVLFLRNGYLDTSIEDIARMASVSKRTVYNNFGDKERLFTEIILGVTATAEEFADQLVRRFSETTEHADDDATDLAGLLGELARRQLAAATGHNVMRLRRLIISEARRFPELASEYHRRAPARVMDALATVLGSLSDRGLLAVPDPRRAAEHFSFLVLGATLDRALFQHADTEPVPSEAELDRIAADGVRVFLAAYRPA